MPIPIPPRIPPIGPPIPPNPPAELLPPDSEADITGAVLVAYAGVVVMTDWGGPGCTGSRFMKNMITVAMMATKLHPTIQIKSF
jgi:hypothetical protein